MNNNTGCPFPSISSPPLNPLLGLEKGEREKQSGEWWAGGGQSVVGSSGLVLEEQRLAHHQLRGGQPLAYYCRHWNVFGLALHYAFGFLFVRH